MAARLVACNIPTSNHPASNAFYQALLGIQPARSLTTQLTAYHLPVSNEGQSLWLTDRQVPQEQPTVVFQVDNLQQAITELTAAGGHQFGATLEPTVAASQLSYFSGAVRGHEPNASPSAQMGSLVYMRDPEGNVLALFQAAGGAEVFLPGTAALSSATLSGHERAVAQGHTLK